MAEDTGRKLQAAFVTLLDRLSLSLFRGRVHSNFARARKRAQKTAEETKVGVNHGWRAMKHFRAALVI